MAMRGFERLTMAEASPTEPHLPAATHAAAPAVTRIVVVSRRPRHRRRWVQALAAPDVGVDIAASVSSSIRLEALALVVLDCPDDRAEASRRCRRARAMFGMIPLLAIGEERGSFARAALFEAGADAVVTRPFAIRELVACVRALLRVRSVSTKPPDRIADVKVAGHLDLTETEQLLLECLRSHPIVTRTQILRTVFPDAHYRADSSHLRVHLHRLRNKLRPLQMTVKSVYGRGYRLLPFGAT